VFLRSLCLFLQYKFSNCRTLIPVQINLKTLVLDKVVVIKPLIELSKLKPKGKLEEVKRRVAGQNRDNVEIELERAAMSALTKEIVRANC
jgi:hypothetical protein